MRRNVCWNISVLLVCLLLLSGCGKQKPDRVEEDLGGIDTSISSDSDAGKASADVPERLTYTLGTSGYKFNVDAEVMATGYENMKVYEQNPVTTLDDEALKNLAEQIFDNGEYEVVKPYGICSVEELREEDLFLRSLYEEAGMEYSSEQIEAYIENYNENNVSELPEGALIYHLEETVDGETVDFEECRLRGMMDGNMSELTYYSSGGNNTMLYVTRYVNDYAHMAMACSTEYELASTLYGENLCNLEEASRKVQDIIDNMGYTDMKQLAVQHNVISDGAASGMHADGYRFIFVRETDGIKNILGDESYAVISDGAGEDITDFPGAGQEFISVDIDSTGILRIFFGRGYEKGGQLSDQTTMLSFEQVDAVAQEYMNDLLESYSGYTGTYDYNIVAVRLGYVTLLYDTQYTLVPVWAYVQEKASEDQTLDRILFGVNALDGSIVQFTYDNMYGSASQTYFY